MLFLFSPETLVQKAPDESIVKPIRDTAIQIVGELNAQKDTGTNLTREQVEIALAFHVFWDTPLGPILTSDASRIWRGAEDGSQILLETKMMPTLLVVRDATWLQRLQGVLPVQANTFYRNPRKNVWDDRTWRPIDHGQHGLNVSPNPHELTDGKITIASSVQALTDLKIHGINTPSNIGFFIPAPFKSFGQKKLTE
jgi:hypothetical protein